MKGCVIVLKKNKDWIIKNDKRIRDHGRKIIQIGKC